jgi:hypothetical protein
MTLSLKVHLPHVINFGAFCGANSVTLPSKFGEKETLELHCFFGEGSKRKARLQGYLAHKKHPPPNVQYDRNYHGHHHARALRRLANLMWKHL